MKIPKTLILIALFLIVIFIAPIAVNCQTSSPEKPSPTVSKEQTVARLISEVKAARELIRVQNEQIAALENQLQTETENSSSINRSYENAKSEINSLRTANDALEKAVALHTETITLLQSDLIKERQSKKKWRVRTFKIGATLAAILITKVL
jgi:chromosome segregation ATPase